MKILHISQGIPPFRVGGLNRYCVDLMEEQVRQGENVSILYPGNYSAGKTRIKKEKSKDYFCYKIINPLPLALIFGINAPERYTRKCDSDCYENFLKEHKFDVIHVHCTMGIHKEFFEAAKAQKIPMVFSTHDYYLLCPKCTFWDYQNKICGGAEPEKCALCNQRIGLSRKMEILMQSNLYAKLKYSPLLKAIRKKARGQVTAVDERAEKELADLTAYESLLNYNREILNLMDLIHCNSSLTRSVYEKFAPDLSYVTVPITHANLPRFFEQKERNEKFRVGYLGGQRNEKGFETLMDAMRLLEQQGITNWELYLYGGDYAEYLQGKSDRYFDKGMFSAGEIEKVFHSLDVIVVPSICYETFSFVVLEALSSGVAVICSDHVGAKDLIVEKDRVFPAGNSKELSLVLKKIFGKEKKCIKKSISVNTMEKHAEDIKKYYEKIGERYDE